MKNLWRREELARAPPAPFTTHSDQFLAELTALTRKYGVAIQSVGGVVLADAPGEFRNVTYRADISSGDLYPEFPGS